MAPLIDDDDSASDKKPAAKQIYYAIRKCDSLRAPAIFLHWDDCSFYVDNDENEDVDFAKFDKVVDAVAYITLKTSIPLVDSGDLVAYQEPDARKKPLQDLKTAAQSTASAPANAAPVARVDSENSKTRAGTDTLKNISIHVRAPEIALLKTAPLPASTTLDSSKVAFQDGDLRKLTWENEFQMMKDGGSRELNWEYKFQMMIAFKEEYGSCELPVIKKHRSEKYKGLYSWAVYWRSNLRNYLENPADSTRSMDDTRMQRLIDFGFAERKFSNVVSTALAAGMIPSRIRKRVDRAASLQSPARKKNKSTPEKFGHVVDGSATPLDADVDFSRNYADDGADDDDSDDAPAEEDAAVASNGMAKINREPKVWPYTDVATSIHFDKKLELLKSFKIVFGHVNVNHNNCTGQFKDLVSFVSNWRLKGRRLGKDPSRKTLSDEAKMYHLTSLGLDLTSDANGRSEGGRKARWEHFFKLITEYKEQHGTCIVSKNNAVTPESKELLQWYRKQRFAFLTHQNDPTISGLDEDQNQRLGGIGFVKTKRKLKNTRCTASSWDEMFLKLKAFVEEHGHAEVPAKPATQLRNWCRVMLQHYDRMKEGKSSHLNPDRIAKLLQLGFSFNAKVERLSFDVRAVQWLEYKSKHAREPKSEHMLGQWVRKIRSKYVMLKAGEKTSLTQKQADKLTEWGFKWDSGYKKPAVVVPTKSWQERFEELCQYKEKHGHCVVPQQYPVLGQWVKRQRRVYTFIQDGTPPSSGNTLTEERIAKLKDIGFVFLTRKRPRKSSESVEAQKKDYDYEGQDGSSSDNDDDSEGDRHSRSHESPRAAARVQNAFAPWD